MTIEQLIKSGKSIKQFRMELIEASHTFTSGSAGELIYKFYQAVKDYYGTLLINQFQLYSDRPRYNFNLTKCRVKLDPEEGFVDFEFSAGNGDFIQMLSVFNSVLPQDVTQVTFQFKLNPLIQDLNANVINNPNFELFKKNRTITVNKADGTAISGNCKPTWTNKGLTIQIDGFTHDTMTEPELIKTGVVNY